MKLFCNFTDNPRQSLYCACNYTSCIHRNTLQIFLEASHETVKGRASHKVCKCRAAYFTGASGLSLPLSFHLISKTEQFSPPFNIWKWNGNKTRRPSSNSRGSWIRQTHLCLNGRMQWGNREGRAGLANTTLLMKCHVNGSVDCADGGSADGFPHHRDVCHADLEYGTLAVFPSHHLSTPSLLSWERAACSLAANTDGLCADKWKAIVAGLCFLTDVLSACFGDLVCVLLWIVWYGLNLHCCS